MRGVIFILLLVLSPFGLIASVASWSVRVPKVVYVQQLPSPSTPITQVDDRLIDLAVRVSQGRLVQERPIFLGIMCNSLDGYQLSLPSLGPGLAWDWGAVRVEPGTHWQVLDLGNTLQVSFSSFQQLPLKPGRANIFELKVKQLNSQSTRDGIYDRQLSIHVFLP